MSDNHLINHYFLALSALSDVLLVDLIVSGQPLLHFEVVHFRLQNAQPICDVLGLLVIVHAGCDNKFAIHIITMPFGHLLLLYTVHEFRLRLN